MKPKEILLLGPGPSPVEPKVMEAIAWPVLGHLDPDFLAIMSETTELLRGVFETGNNVTLPLSGTGSSGMETAFVNFVEPGDKVLVGVNGVFGARMADMASRCRAEVVEVKAPWGKPLDPGDVEKALDANPGVKFVAFVQAETSTGVLTPVEPLVEMAHRRGALVIADTVSSLGGVPVAVDRRGLDIVFSGSQKCLSCPPGLAPFTANERALEVLRGRKTKVPSWYFDLSMITQYWGKERFYHHTAPVSMIYAIYMALRLVKEEGLEARFGRHRLNSDALAAGLRACGLRLLVEDAYRLPSLTAVCVPEGVSDLDVRGRLRREHGIEIGGGLGELKGRIWRVGLMGYGSRRENVERLLAALCGILNDLGFRCSADEALAAAARVYAGPAARGAAPSGGGRDGGCVK
jgi:alanine-glyoxylate transaminase/serine-glyoxylate transaminase/serine-pyruvate transaminase